MRKAIFLVTVILMSAVQPVYAADIRPALAATFGHEGGFQKDPGDSGNYAYGKLVGTKFGIAAASYPKEDIPNLTIERAAVLYERDFWGASSMNDVKSQIIANVFFDSAVNMGQGTVARLLQRAINYAGWPKPPLAVDGKIGKATIERMNSVDQPALFVHFIGLCYGRYEDIVNANPAKARYFRTWAYRMKQNVQRSVHDYESRRQ